ncbi:MAG: MYXO-CTERM sorting domain-containing protein [Kofleriaceae bacterium]
MSTGALGVVTLFAAAAVAEPTAPTQTDPSTPANKSARIAVPTPLEAFTPTAHHAISKIIYLERCIGNCTVNRGSVNDARTNTSTIPQGTGPFTVQEYRNAAGQTGSDADAEWSAIVHCVREVYSPYNVVVTDQKPAGGVSYHMAMIAGNPGDVGLEPTTLGIAPLAGDCSPQDNVISFSFANAHGPSERVNTVCWTASQETAHAFGLDHEYEFLPDKRSACNDPMTYRMDCGGQKFFRNEVAACGTFAPEECHCGGTQNSHLKILSVFGTGMPITGLPSSMITFPAPGAELGAVVGVSAGSKRGVAKVELLVNGFKWAEEKGKAFGINGQPNPSSYTINVPGNIPGGVIDLVARAYDDLGDYKDSDTIRIQKGAACVDASTCAPGQRCDAEGRCLWDPPAGEIGADCTYKEFCKSMRCEGTVEQKICTQSCVPGATDSCPADSGLTCVQAGPGQGICFFGGDDEGGGCCSVNNNSAPWVYALIAAGLIGVLGRRRRRTRS